MNFEIVEEALRFHLYGVFGLVQDQNYSEVGLRLMNHPQKWKDLQAELIAGGETIDSPSLEIYGHHCEDSAKLETTILIGLQSMRAGPKT